MIDDWVRILRTCKVDYIYIENKLKLPHLLQEADRVGTRHMLQAYQSEEMHVSIPLPITLALILLSRFQEKLENNRVGKTLSGTVMFEMRERIFLFQSWNGVSQETHTERLGMLVGRNN